MPEKTFEEKRGAPDDWLGESTGEVTYVERLNREERDADEMLEHIIEHFTPRDLWPAKIDAALDAAHQAGERGDPLEGLDLGLG